MEAEVLKQKYRKYEKLSSFNLVSVIIPIYNTAPFLKRCIDSIVSQTYENLEIILVNDGSTDNSMQICEEYRESDGRVHVVCKENGGLSSARNAGIEISHGEYICFVDSDDSVLPDMVKLLMDTIHKTGAEVSTCRFRVIFPYGTENFSTTGEIYRYSPKEYFFELIRRHDFKPEWSANCKLFSRRIINDLRFDESIFCTEDVDFCIRCLPNANLIVVADTIEYNYIIRSTSLSRTMSTESLACRLKTAITVEEYASNNFSEQENEKTAVGITYSYMMILNLLYNSKKANISNIVKDGIDERLKKLLFGKHSSNIPFAYRVFIRIEIYTPYICKLICKILSGCNQLIQRWKRRNR